MLKTYEQDHPTAEDLRLLREMGDRFVPKKTSAEELAEAIALSLQTWIDVPLAQGPYSPLPIWETRERAYILGGVAA